MSERPFTDSERRIAETMSPYWANFAKNGDPNGPGLAPWPAADEQPSRIMHIGETIGAMPVAAGGAAATR